MDKYKSHRYQHQNSYHGWSAKHSLYQYVDLHKVFHIPSL
ncbi:hypothetical protein COPEUT_02624 [Coprococcus eutactus ATCC 27759]|nr:hypothetical protein COPEUT_02624 [Coprococcus eutactus ATCC 27759]